MKTVRLTAAAAIVRFLKEQYLERDGAEHRIVHGVFGIFGHGNVAGLGQALEEHGGRELPFFQPKNEQAMVHTAVAFAKARRGLGTYACTTSVGPGATNLVTGAATATINRLPVLLLPGDIFSNRRPAPVLQQLEHSLSQDVSVNDCLKPVSRYWDRIHRPEQLLSALPEAMRILSDPSLAGAVTIALPEDVQAEAFDFPASFFEKRVFRIPRLRPDEDEVARAAALVRTARRPLIVAGGGVFYSEASQALQSFIEKTGIPVAFTQAGKGSFSDAHPLSLGAIGVTGTEAADRIAEQADLVIALGTRLSDFTTASKTQFQAEGVRFVGINLSSYDARKHGAFPLVGDARRALDGLAQALSGYSTSNEYRREVSDARERWVSRRRQIVGGTPGRSLTQAQAIAILNEDAAPSATVVHAAGGLPGDLHKLWLSRGGGDYHSEYGYSCMGYEIAGALGVKLADPSREVYAFLGDGSYLMLNHEIVTSIQEGLKITVVMIENGGYQCIHGLQRSLGSGSFGNEFRHRDPEKGRIDGPIVAVDYLANARSLGAVTFDAPDEPSLRKALMVAREEKSTCFIRIQTVPGSGVPGFSWWDVPIAEASDSASVKEARAAYENALKKQKFYY
jgi:3D-(3,5/4)-trihydroxycyclohexane-1,2-dione acylhydrolase (decyclizing)